MIKVSTSDAGEQFDLVFYSNYIDAQEQDRFVHQTPDGTLQEILNPNEYRDLSFEKQPTILKLYGSADQIEEGKNDNFLTAGELYNLNMDAMLVFLGACNSGFGKINRGEGIMSLSRSFAYAGCPSIIMSLWSVPDDETATITN